MERSVQDQVEQTRRDVPEDVPETERCTSAVRVAAIAATMPVGIATAASVKMAGYLEKRGKRVSTLRARMSLGGNH
jgi:hypothetical protein